MRGVISVTERQAYDERACRGQSALKHGWRMAKGAQ